MTAFLRVFLGAVLTFSIAASAQALETPAVQERLDPWLREAQRFQIETERRLTLDAPALTDLASPAFIMGLMTFAEKTQDISTTVKELPAGSEPACILKGFALDLEAKAQQLADAPGPADASVALSALGQLLMEPLLIFGAPINEADFDVDPTYQSAVFEIFHLSARAETDDCSGLPA